MKQLTIDDLENLSLGSSILGSGGGGDPAYVLLMAKYLIEKYGPIKIISVDELKVDDLIVPIAIMGAPLINMERLLSGNELDILLQMIEERLLVKPTVLMAAEIGGANAFTPLLAAAKTGLPVLDADMIGRAFPELQMSSCCLKNLKSTPAVMVDCLGNSVIIETASANTLEKIARSVTVAMGSSCAVGFYLMQGLEVPGAVIAGTLSQAIQLGKCITTARQEGIDPIQALINASDAISMGKGTLIDIDQTVKDGFLQGVATILNEEGKIKFCYQNEYLLAKNGSSILASTPDILVLLEENSGTPLTSESLRYGLQVNLLVLPAPRIWQTKEGLELVGPRVFGYNIEYQPISLNRSQEIL
jgi:uncharacterized protein